MRIGSREIGSGCDTFVIAELSCNHMGDLKQAQDLVYAAAHAGADAIKLQTFTPNEITAPATTKAFRLSSGPWRGLTLHELYEKAHTPWAWHEQLFWLAHELGMEAFSSPFSVAAVEFLESIQCPAYKIASPEVTDHHLLEAVAATGKPTLISTGMMTPLDEDRILDLFPQSGRAFLDCVSAYPAAIEDMQLQRLRWFVTQRELAGLSDHTLGWLAATLSVGLGAKIIEKHLMLPDTHPLDARFASEPHDFARMVQAIREADQALQGRDLAGPPADAVQRRLVFNVRLPEGTPILPAHVRTARAMEGLSARELDRVIGRTVRRGVEQYEPVMEEVLNRDSAR